MHDDEGAVLAEVEVQFDDIEAGLLGGHEGTEGVLGFDTHDSAVTDGKEVQGSTRFRRRRRGELARTGADCSRGPSRSLVACARDEPHVYAGFAAGDMPCLVRTPMGGHPGVGESSGD
ncbi:hypothetical protein GCM10022295_33260 [Streptomyces osmaniensis]|uniref:Uncharacterized protein n=1 Tax=Streptomyces osmaniensis TaxID=593134 RepID=A0ABP6WC73_9ACTN